MQSNLIGSFCPCVFKPNFKYSESNVLFIVKCADILIIEAPRIIYEGKEMITSALAIMIP